MRGPFSPQTRTDSAFPQCHCAAQHCVRTLIQHFLVPNLLDWHYTLHCSRHTTTIAPTHQAAILPPASSSQKGDTKQAGGAVSHPRTRTTRVLSSSARRRLPARSTLRLNPHTFQRAPCDALKQFITKLDPLRTITAFGSSPLSHSPLRRLNDE